MLSPRAPAVPGALRPSQVVAGALESSLFNAIHVSIGYMRKWLLVDGGIERWRDARPVSQESCCYINCPGGGPQHQGQPGGLFNRAMSSCLVSGVQSRMPNYFPVMLVLVRWISVKYLERDGQHGARGPDAKLNKAWPLALEITRNISVYKCICFFWYSKVSKGKSSKGTLLRPFKACIRLLAAWGVPARDASPECTGQILGFWDVAMG